jgi:hypothetical protein
LVYDNAYGEDELYDIEIKPCPKHAAVDDLLAALEKIANGVCVYGSSANVSGCLADESKGEWCYPHIARTAIAKAKIREAR